MDVNEDGVTEIDGTTLEGMGGFSGLIDLGSNGLVYGVGGGIINPNTTPPSQVATLPLIDFYASGINGTGAGVAADPSLGKDFLMLTNTAGTWAYGLARYDLSRYLPRLYWRCRKRHPASKHNGRCFVSARTDLRFGPLRKTTRPISRSP